MFMDINNIMFWARLRLILTRDARQGKINSVTIIITLELEHWENREKKNDNNTV